MEIQVTEENNAVAEEAKVNFLGRMKICALFLLALLVLGLVWREFESRGTMLRAIFLEALVLYNLERTKRRGDFNNVGGKIFYVLLSIVGLGCSIYMSVKFFFLIK
ncbi:hypothetical protein CASFOL_020689 [Castilleja foliolosa]|uniref:DUF4181 domain-containing protein n=1 Tax=Castilleja foliolosa TaxID=1961234 RepID=A0ABD3D326_9LAMI